MKKFNSLSDTMKVAIVGAIITGTATIIGAIIGGIFLLTSNNTNHSTPPANAAAADAVATTTTQAHASATASAVATSQCQFGTLQSQTAIQTKVEVIPDGSALVVTLPTAGDAQVVVLFASHSDLDKYVCQHDLALIPVTHTGPEILVLHEDKGRSSVDLILYRGSPTIEVVPNTQTDSIISNFKQSDSNARVYQDTNHQQSTPDQQTIP